MSEHRPVLDPAILGRLATSMAQFEQAWLSDLIALRRTEARLADIERERNAAIDRADNLQSDLVAARQEVSDLIHRNAHLEAQVQKLYEGSEDAKDALTALAQRAVEAARSAPHVSTWRDPEKNPPGDADEPPASFRRPAAAIVAQRDSRIPNNDFQPRQAAQ